MGARKFNRTFGETGGDAFWFEGAIALPPQGQQFFYMLKGEATFYADNHKHILKPLQGISVSPMVKHFIANETNADIEFLVISQPTIGNDRVNL